MKRKKNVLLIFGMSLLFVVLHYVYQRHQFGSAGSFQQLKRLFTLGHRQIGTSFEVRGGDFVYSLFAEYLKTHMQYFEYSLFNTDVPFVSRNVIGEIEGDESAGVVLVGAHYDTAFSTDGVVGSVNNGTGIAILLSLARRLSNAGHKHQIRLIAFGASEMLKRRFVGSRFYLNNLSPQEEKKIKMVVMLDSLVAGDHTYVYAPKSADVVQVHSYLYPEDSKVKLQENYDQKQESVANFLIEASKNKLFGDFKKYVGLRAGDLMSNSLLMSDYLPFLSRGIPVVFIYSGNADLLAQHGQPSFSQTSDPKFWDCFDVKQNSACNPKMERQWGRINGTHYDNLSLLLSFLGEQKFSGRLHATEDVVFEFLQSWNFSMRQE